MSEPRKARAIGINHVALEVGDIDQALEFYGAWLDFELRGRSDTMAFIDLGDQFLNFSSAASELMYSLTAVNFINSAHSRFPP